MPEPILNDDWQPKVNVGTGGKPVWMYVHKYLRCVLLIYSPGEIPAMAINSSVSKAINELVKFKGHLIVYFPKDSEIKTSVYNVANILIVIKWLAYVKLSGIQRAVYVDETDSDQMTLLLSTGDQSFLIHTKVDEALKVIPRKDSV